MIENVIKRDGTLEKYNFEKIVNAVALAFNSCKCDLSDDIIVKLKNYVETKITDVEEVDIELIQDVVISFLIDTNEEVGKHYKKVRDSRERARNKKNKILRGMKEKLDAKNIENQNANVDEMSFGGRKGEAMEVATKAIALEEYISDMARKNHLENRDYIHDLGSYADGEHNCLSIPFDPLLAKGFKVKQTDVRPAGSIGTAAQLIAVIFQLQSLQQFGGVSATHIDHTLVPYVRKSFMKHYVLSYLKKTPEFIKLDLLKMLFEEDIENINDGGNVFDIHRSMFDVWFSDHKSECLLQLGLTESDFFFDNKDNLDAELYQSALLDTILETKQSIEGMYHNLNTLQSRSGNQLPFTSINYGTNTTPEGRLIIESLLDISIKGLGAAHKTPIFPCGIWQYMKGVNDKPGTPNYDLKRKACYSAATRFYPNVANVDWSGNAGYDRNDPRTYFSTMGCRTANGWDINGFGQLKDGRGNICPCTIILPTIAMEAREKVDKKPRKMSEGDLQRQTAYVEKFMKMLEKNIGEVKDMLLERFEWICSQPAESARFMYENNTMAGYVPSEGIRSALKHGTLAIGQLGLAECLQILIGCDHTTRSGMLLAKRIEQLFKDKAAEYKEQYKLNFGVYYTPAENLCYTAYKKFVAKWGHVEGVTNYWKEDEYTKDGKLIPAHWEPRNYFTNSMHVPVWKKMDPFEKIDIESQLTGYSSAGCITYVELPASVKYNVDAVESIWDYMMEKDIPYGAINPTIDQCLDCGFTDEIGETCPICGSQHIFRPRRVTGYLSTDYRNFNLGKQFETGDRVKHITN